MNDIINACFELFAAIVLILNIRAILRDKTVKGVSFAPSAIFCIWGFWNIYYYSQLGQTASALAAALVAVSNALWLCIALWYAAFGWLDRHISVFSIDEVSSDRKTTNDCSSWIDSSK